MNENNQMRVDVDFKKQINEIIVERIKNGIDKKMRSFERITKAIVRLPNWKSMKEKIIDSDFIEDKKGQTTDVLTFVIIAFVAVLFILLWVYTFGIMSNAFADITQFAGSVNVSETAENTFGQMNNAFKSQADLIALAILFGMMLEIFIINYFTKKHPIFFVVHVVITMIAVLVSVYLSNIYETFITGYPFSSIIVSNMAISSSIMLHLPIWATVIGLLGAVFLVIGYVRSGRIIG